MMKKTKMTARYASIACMMLICGCGNEVQTLHLYTWADYIDLEVIEEFEKENKCKVVVDTFDSNEAAYAKLMSGAAGYDIVVPTAYLVPSLVAAKIIDEVDMSKLSNVSANFDKRYLRTKDASLLKWHVPYAFSVTGIMYRKDKVPKDLSFNDWNDLFDKRLAGKVCMMDDIREVLGIALKMNGHSINETNEAALAQAASLAKSWKSVCAKMDNEAYRVGIPSGEFYAAMAYASDAIQLIVEDESDTIRFSIPTNGTTSGFDVMVFMKDSQAKDLSYKLVDKLYDVEVAAKNAEYICAPVPVAGVEEHMSKKYRDISRNASSNEVLDRAEDIEDIADALESYSKAWDKVKSTKEN